MSTEAGGGKSGGRARRRLVVEADGGSRGNPGPAGYGALVRDGAGGPRGAGGTVLVEVADAIGRATNNVAEYRGLIAGLRAAAEVDPQADVHVRMDSKLVVEQMSGRWRIKHPDLRPLADEARAVLDPARVSYEWVPRELNSAADRLANAALDAAERGERWRPASGPWVDEAEIESAARGAGGDTAALPTPPGFGPDIGDPTVLWMLRHGVTECTAGRLFCGLGGDDPPLADTGVEQAKRAAVALEGRAIVAVVSSPLRRARQTAQIAAETLGLDVEVDDGLAECGFGAWDGRTYAEVADAWPDELRAWLGSPDVAPPGGESLTQVRDRVRAALRRTTERHARHTVLVVAHVTPIKLLVQLALDAPLSTLYRMELAPASIHRADFYRDGPATLRAFNETTHLADIAAPREG